MRLFCLLFYFYNYCGPVETMEDFSTDYEPVVTRSYPDLDHASYQRKLDKCSFPVGKRGCEEDVEEQ